MFRLLCACNLALILPMMAIGMMAGLSGGGLTPAYQRIGTRFLVASAPLAIGCSIGAEIVFRLGLTVPAYIISAVPLVVWAAWWIELVQKTKKARGK